jgi:hypothetical protein
MKITFNGKEVEATPVDILSSKEIWNEYQIRGGNTIRIKLIVTKILRIEGENGVDGKPIYQVRSQNVTDVE